MCLCCGQYSIKKLRQPYRCCAKCTIASSIFGFFCFVIGIILLAYFGSHLKAEELKKKIPAWAGLVAFLLGLLCIVYGIIFIVFLLRMIRNMQNSSKLHRGQSPGNPAKVSSPAASASPSAPQQYTPVPTPQKDTAIIIPQEQKM